MDIDNFQLVNMTDGLNSYQRSFSLGFTTTSCVGAGVMLLAGITFGATGSYKIISLG